MIIEMNKETQFEGWSRLDIETLMYFPWRNVTYGNTIKLSPVRLKENVTFDDIKDTPLISQIHRLLELLSEKGEIKLTANGYLPLSIVNVLYPLGIPDPYYEKPDYKGKMHQIRTEKDTLDVSMAHAIVRYCRWVKVRYGKLSLTSAGKKVLKDPVSMLEPVLVVLCQGGFIDQFDAYNEYNNFEGVSLHGELMFLLLAKYGDEYRDALFYGEKFWRMNPRLIDFEDGVFDRLHPSQTAYRCISLRLIERTMYRLGLVDMQIERRVDFLDEHSVKRSELFDKIIKIDKP